MCVGDRENDWLSEPRPTVKAYSLGVEARWWWENDLMCFLSATEGLYRKLIHDCQDPLPVHSTLLINPNTHEDSNPYLLEYC